MSRIKIDYGIDLGTTNSAIAVMQEGKSVIIKALDTQKDITPSCVHFNKKGQIRVGDTAKNAYRAELKKALLKKRDEKNGFVEFKRTMGTDAQYFSSNMGKNFSSEELSAEVLKALKSYVLNEQVKFAVITVPAKFTINQKDATKRTAKIAGVEYVELLQEPVAAAMAYGINNPDKNGYWFVFDFGGGTFDAALLKVNEGIINVIDTHGDNYLGGKNLDYEVVDKILLPYLRENYEITSLLQDEKKAIVFKELLKFYAEELRIELSSKEKINFYVDPGDIGEDDNGEEIEIEINLSRQELKEVLAPVLQRAINISKELLSRNNLSGKDLRELILVGGPTLSPALREMVAEQLKTPNTEIDPTTIVAQGAAIYASTLDIPENLKTIASSNNQLVLSLGYEATTIETEEFVTIAIKNPPDEKVFIQLSRDDNAWTSGKKEVAPAGELFEVLLNKNKPNTFKIEAFNPIGDRLECSPSSFTIIHGAKVGTVTLPYSMGVEIKDIHTGKLFFKSIKGLEINQPLPATGVMTSLKTQKDIRPGIKEDTIKIAVYQGDYESEGSRAIYNEHVYTFIITGEELPKFLPAGSEVDLTIEMDRSEQITVKAYFPAIDYTHEITGYSQATQKEVDANWLLNELNKAKQSIALIKQEEIYDNITELNNLLTEIKKLKEKLNTALNDYDTKKEILNNIRKIFIKIDKINEQTEWPKIERELKEVFEELEEANEKFNDSEVASEIQNMRMQIPDIIAEKDVKTARELIEVIRTLKFLVLDKHLGAKMEIMMLVNIHEDFNIIDWKDRRKARFILEKGLALARQNPAKEELRAIVISLLQLMPPAQRAIIEGDGSELMG